MFFILNHLLSIFIDKANHKFKHRNKSWSIKNTHEIIYNKNHVKFLNFAFLKIKIDIAKWQTSYLQMKDLRKIHEDSNYWDFLFPIYTKRNNIRGNFEICISF